MNRLGVSRACTLYHTKRRLSLVKMACWQSSTPNLGVMKSQRGSRSFPLWPLYAFSLPVGLLFRCFIFFISIHSVHSTGRWMSWHSSTKTHVLQIYGLRIHDIMTSTWWYIWNSNIGLIKHPVLRLFETSPFQWKLFSFILFPEPSSHLSLLRVALDTLLIAVARPSRKQLKKERLSLGISSTMVEESMLAGISSYLGEPGRRNQTGSINYKSLLTVDVFSFLKILFQFLLLFHCDICLFSSFWKFSRQLLRWLPSPAKMASITSLPGFTPPNFSLRSVNRIQWLTSDEQNAAKTMSYHLRYRVIKRHWFTPSLSSFLPPFTCFFLFPSPVIF